MSETEQPKWLRDITQLLPIRAQFVLTGNFRDTVLLRGKALSLQAALWDTLKAQGYKGLLIWDVVDGLQAYPHEPEVMDFLSDFTGESFSSKTPSVDMSMQALASGLIKRVNAPNQNNQGPVALLIDYASRLSNDERSSDRANELFVAAEKASNLARPIPRQDMPGTKPLFNPVFWLVNRPGDLPYWFTVDSDRIRTISLPAPASDTRVQYSRMLFSLIKEENRDLDEETFAKTLSSFTHNMSLSNLSDIVLLAERMDLKASDIEDAVQSFRVGDTSMTSPWRTETLHNAVRKADAIIPDEVMGQPKPVRKVVDVLMRTVTGLTAAHSGNSASRPRGILFFLGPTGVGKTLMAKTIAKLVFGDESSYLRFDMSEFSAEHSGDRLIGAPPGYVGFDQGGELTNAMRENPFRVLLFDEIEKAHDRILDKFLQILEDGRLTDGRGDTVYFSESLIVFTSNLGVLRELPNGEVEQLVTPDDDLADAEKKIMQGVKDHFYRKLRRPELFNRIGNNFVVFNYITPEVAKLILQKMLGNVKVAVVEEQGVNLEVSEKVELQIEKVCTSESVLLNGGRGIGSKLEEVFVNPLARLFFTENPKANSTLKIIDMNEDVEGYRLECEVT